MKQCVYEEMRVPPAGAPVAVLRPLVELPVLKPVVLSALRPVRSRRMLSRRIASKFLPRRRRTLSPPRPTLAAVAVGRAVERVDGAAVGVPV
jgi:hypothetical protein